MKWQWSAIVIVLATAVSIFTFSRRIDSEHDDIDRVAAAMNKAKAILPETAKVTFRASRPDPEMEYQTLFAFSRLALAPRLVTHNDADTMLSICYAADTSTVTFTHIYWETRDDKYRYTLSAR